MRSCAFSAIPYSKIHLHVQSGRGNVFGAKKIALNATKHELEQPLAKIFVPVVLRHDICAKLLLITQAGVSALLSIIPCQRVTGIAEITLIPPT